MKTKVLDFLADKGIAPKEQYNIALKLLIESNAPETLIRSYNNRIYSQPALENIRYDLQRHLGISKVELLNYKPSALTVANVERKVNERKETDLIEIENNGKVFFDKLVSEMSAEEKEGFSIFSQYPFLREADCPNEMKILVNDKITAFINFKEAHKELFDKVANVAEPALSPEEIYDMAFKVVKDFVLNQEIKAELDHYKDNKEILGKHPIFEDLQMQKEVDAIPATKLQGKYNNLKSQISKNKNNPEKVAKLEKMKDKIDERIKSGK